MAALTLETARRIQFRQHPTLTACWIWTGRIGSNGLPEWKFAGANTTARMSVYRQLRRESPTRLKARCQESLCVNPNHMGGVMTVHDEMEARSDLIDKMAEAFHKAAQEHPGCVAFDWDELSDEHRAWKIASMRAALDALKAAGWEVVKLPESDMVGEYGSVWTCQHRFNGPIGDVQFRPETGRIEIRDDYERDYTPADVRRDALVILAAARAAEAAADAGQVTPTNGPERYELLEDVPNEVTRVLSESGQTNATRNRTGWWDQRSEPIPLDARGPWIPVQRTKSTAARAAEAAQ